MKKNKMLTTLVLSSLLVGCNVTLGGTSNNSEDINSASSSENISINNSENVSQVESESPATSEFHSEEELVSSEEKESNNSLEAPSTSSEADSTPVIDKNFTRYGVYSEGIFGEWSDSNSDNAKVYYKKSGAAEYIQIDEELVRNEENSTARFDILGLSSGIYDVKVITSSNETIEMKNIAVSSFDRSGFAHFNNSKSVGGYNNDGTVREGATIIYVTEENKNTVKHNGKTGLGNIITSPGSKPLIIRMIGRVSTRSFDQDKKTYTRDDKLGITDLNGLVNKDNGDNSYWNMGSLVSTGGLTLEGVGENAEIFQWGFTIKNSKYVEVRNITFTDYPEDACAIEGSSEDATGCQYVWVHNNVFNAGKNYVDQTSEQDKPNGDGATDMKQCMNVTLSYNVYNKCHKTGLVGGGDSQLSNRITFHHNYYNQCKSRLPLGRQANMHMYNNYYYKISGTTMSIRAKAYALSEYNYFDSCSNPVETASSGAVKSYNNIFKSCSGKQNATIVTDRAKTVSNSNTFNKNFDTDSSYFYYDSANKVTDVAYLSSAEQAKNDCPKYAGLCKSNPLSTGSSDIGGSNSQSSASNSSVSSITSSSVSSSETISHTPTGESTLFNAANLETADNITSNKTSGIFTVTASSSKPVSVTETDGFTSFDSSFKKVVNLQGGGSDKHRSIKFELESTATIEIYAKSNKDSEARHIEIIGDAEYVFEGITGPTKLTYTLDAGTYYVCSAASGMSIAAIRINY